MGAAAGGVLALELCAPLLLLCWLCCWSDDHDDSSSSGHPRKPVIANDGSRRRSQLRTRLAGSAVSLHLPGPSGSPCLPAHRSHEDLSSARHHSAPSVIHEVLHRRDWDSSRDLYIPLRAPSPPRCKKHHANIKRSRAPPADQQHGVDGADGGADEDGSLTSFYIGDEGNVEEKPHCPDKEEKQCMNESIRSKEQQLQHWRLAGAEPSLPELRPLDDLLAPLEALDSMQDSPEHDVPDRSGAVHHALDSRAAALGYAGVATMSPISVDVVGYEYPAAGGSARDAGLAGGAGAAGLAGDTGAGAGAGGAARARHASDGDILAPAPRPESGAFSESDVDLEMRLALAEDPREEASAPGTRGGAPRARGDRRETAI